MIKISGKLQNTIPRLTSSFCFVLSLYHAQTGVALAKYYAAEKMALIDQSREAAKDALKQKICELIKASDAGLSVRQMQRRLRTYSATLIRNALKDIPEATPHQNHPAEGGWSQVTSFVS